MWHAGRFDERTRANRLATYISKIQIGLYCHSFLIRTLEGSLYLILILLLNSTERNGTNGDHPESSPALQGGWSLISQAYIYIYIYI